MNYAVIMHAAALFVGLFMLMSGIAFFVAGLLPGDSASWPVQYGFASLALTSAYYLLPYAVGH